MKRDSKQRPHILVYSRRPEEFADWLAEHDCPGTISIAATPDAAREIIEDVDVLLAWRFPVELLGCAKRLRWIQSLGAGVDDLVAASALRSDVAITRIVGQFGGSIAEYVFAELLARVREFDRLRRQQCERRWEHFVADTLVGNVLGVAGLGSIGAEIVRKARAFDMTVYGLSRTDAHASLVDRHFTADAWTDFVCDLDVLVLTLPLTPETTGVVDGRVLSAMSKRAILVNVGRGRLVCESDLIEALRDGRIGGAVLDVFDQEPLPADSPLWALPNVTVTPHVAGPSTRDGVGTFFIDNLHRFLQGDELVGLADRARGY